MLVLSLKLTMMVRMSFLKRRSNSSRETSRMQNMESLEKASSAMSSDYLFPNLFVRVIQ